MEPRQCILMRHAHAEWPAYQGRDFDRPLTPRGEEQACAAAAAIHRAGLQPTRILASPAVRTRQTAERVAAGLGLAATAIDYITELYNSNPATLEAALLGSSKGGLQVLIAHNPGISTLARQLSEAPEATSFAPAHWCAVTLPAR